MGYPLGVDSGAARLPRQVPGVSGLCFMVSLQPIESFCVSVLRKWHGHQTLTFEVNETGGPPLGIEERGER